MYEMKTNKKAFESQQKIYKALRRILKNKPLKEVTVSDICEECQISRTTFYRNFSNVTEILEVIFEFFYNKYLNDRQGAVNQLLYFFEFWYWHRDLLHIIASQSSSIIKNCMIRHEPDLQQNPYELDIKYSLLTSLVSKWSELKEKNPQEMYDLTRNMLQKKAIELLLL